MIYDQYRVGTKLTIMGSTNYNKSIEKFYSIFKGLLKYNKTHSCDFVDGLLHKNYLGETLGLPSNEVISKNQYLAFSALTNGYIVLSLIKNKLMLEFFSIDDINDPDLIIDHLVAQISTSSESEDGFGMYNYSYKIESVNHINSTNQTNTNEQFGDTINYVRKSFYDEDGLFLYSRNIIHEKIT
jgi:hypothetical protein